MEVSNETVTAVRGRASNQDVRKSAVVIKVIIITCCSKREVCMMFVW